MIGLITTVLEMRIWWSELDGLTQIGIFVYGIVATLVAGIVGLAIFG